MQKQIVSFFLTRHTAARHKTGDKALDMVKKIRHRPTHKDRGETNTRSHKTRGRTDQDQDKGTNCPETITHNKAVKSLECRLSCLFLCRVHLVSKVLFVFYFLTVLAFRYLVLLYLVFFIFLSLLSVCPFREGSMFHYFLDKARQTKNLRQDDKARQIINWLQFC